MVGFYFVNKKSSKVPSGETGQVTMRAISNVAPAPPKAVRFHQSSELVLQRQLVAMEENLKISNVFLNGDDKTLTIEVKFLPQKLWCQAGDLDIMRIDQRNDGSPPLLMTIETLAGGKSEKYVKRFQLIQLNKPNSFTFTIKNSGDPLYMGLFMCQDKFGDGSCSKKKLTLFSEIYDQYLKQLTWGSTEIGRYPVQDHVYYFQFLTIKDKRLYIGDPSLFAQKNYKNALGNYLNLADSSLNAEQLTEMVAGYSKNTGSLAAMKTPEGLSFKLPFNDPRCTAIQTR